TFPVDAGRARYGAERPISPYDAACAVASAGGEDLVFVTPPLVADEPLPEMDPCPAGQRFPQQPAVKLPAVHDGVHLVQVHDHAPAARGGQLEGVDLADDQTVGEVP